MAEINVVSGTLQRYQLGNRYLVCGVADEVTNSGDYLTAADLEISSIERVVCAVCKEDVVAIQAVENSQDGSATTAGSLYLKTASGTHDVHFAVIAR